MIDHYAKIIELDEHCSEISILDENLEKRKIIATPISWLKEKAEFKNLVQMLVESSKKKQVSEQVNVIVSKAIPLSYGDIVTMYIKFDCRNEDDKKIILSYRKEKDHMIFHFDDDTVIKYNNFI